MIFVLKMSIVFFFVVVVVVVVFLKQIGYADFPFVNGVDAIFNGRCQFRKRSMPFLKGRCDQW